jgi:predicted dienelactone hydrolase
MITRRSLLAAGALLPVVLAPGPAWGATTPRLTLPAPTGRYKIGTSSFRLVDRSRRRELMSQIWYPATVTRQPAAPWMREAPLQALLASAGFDPATSPVTSAHEDAPPLRSLGPMPIILYSHGAGGHRSEATIVVQELASHGYAVLAVDHTGDAYTEFPDGRLSVPAGSSTPWDHAFDMLFVLDRLAQLPLLLNHRRIGMFGWSKGATATALVMNSDRRVRAGLSLDGPMESQPRPAAIDRPFMLMTAEYNRDAPDSPVAEFWALLRGWRRDLRVEGAPHSGFVDHQWLIPQLGLDEEELAGWIGTLDPARAVRMQQVYPLAFFDQHLRL